MTLIMDNLRRHLIHGIEKRPFRQCVQCLLSANKNGTGEIILMWFTVTNLTEIG